MTQEDQEKNDVETQSHKPRENTKNEKITHEIREVREKIFSGEISVATFLHAYHTAHYIYPNLVVDNGLSREDCYAFYVKIIRDFEASNGKIVFETEDDIKNYIISLPEEIRGSKKNYSYREIAMIASDVICSDTPADWLTSSLGIREKITRYMRGRLIMGSKIFPEVFTTPINPCTQKEIESFEERYLLADYIVRMAQLPPTVLESLSRGYEKMEPWQRGEYIGAIAEIHGGIAWCSGQDHLFFSQRDIEMTKQEVFEKRGTLTPILATVDHFREEYLKAIRNGQLQYAERLRKQAQRYIDDQFPYLATEFKIHLHPELRLMPVVFDRLLLGLRIDPYLRNNIIGIKIARTSNKEEEYRHGIVPNIVIYPRRLDTDKSSKELAQFLAERIRKKLQDLEIPEANAHEVPRFNHQLTNIMYIAQSGGDLKQALIDLGLIDRYFDRKTNYGLSYVHNE